MKKKYIKVVIIGDGSVGKTSLLLTKSKGVFPIDYVPTLPLFDDFPFNIRINDQINTLNIYDTRGGGEYSRLITLSFPQTNLFLICFSISSRNSFNNCITNWLPEVTTYLPSVPIILVGTKFDLRDCDDYLDKSEFVTYKEGIEMKDKIGALAYFECSSLLNKGLNDLFDAMAIIGDNDLKSIIPIQLIRDKFLKKTDIYQTQRNNFEINDNNKKCIIC
ncbi:hypothetical protein ACTA71_005905 [Dictyostelium dimigraforme]